MHTVLEIAISQKLTFNRKYADTFQRHRREYKSNHLQEMDAAL